MSSHDPREILGLGKADTVDSLGTHWARPSQQVDRFTSLPIGRHTSIVEGKGIARER